MWWSKMLTISSSITSSACKDDFVESCALNRPHKNINVKASNRGVAIIFVELLHRRSSNEASSTTLQESSDKTDVMLKSSYSRKLKDTIP